MQAKPDRFLDGADVVHEIAVSHDAGMTDYGPGVNILDRDTANEDVPILSTLNDPFGIYGTFTN